MLSQSPEPQSSSCHQCQHNQDSISSSSCSDSQSISVHITSRLNQIQHKSGLKILESQLSQVMIQNQQLRAQNSRLLKQIQGKSRQNDLKNKVKQQQRWIDQMKMHMSSYYQIKDTTPVIASIEQKQHKINRRSKKQKQKQKHRHQQQQQKSYEEQSKEYQWNNTWRQAQRRKMQQQLSVLKQRLEQLQCQLGWMESLCVKLIGMSKKVSKIFGQKVIHKNWSLRKQTLIAWKYVKHVVCYFMDTQQS